MPGGAEQASTISPKAARALGVMPTQDTLVLERFFDESGGMQLVLHAPFGSRINKAWGAGAAQALLPPVQLRAAGRGDRRCAAAVARAAAFVPARRRLPLSASGHAPATSSCRRCSTRRCSRRAGAGTRRSRWPSRATAAARRCRRSCSACMADDLMAAVFPDAAACLENIPGDREIPDHPLVNQTVRDCLEEAMDFDGLARVLTRIHARRDALRRARHARAVAVRARDPQRAAVRVPGRCAARGAADAGGADARGERPAGSDMRRARRRRRSSACATKSVPIRATPTNCTTRC